MPRKQVKSKKSKGCKVGLKGEFSPFYLKSGITTVEVTMNNPEVDLLIRYAKFSGCWSTWIWHWKPPFRQNADKIHGLDWKNISLIMYNWEMAQYLERLFRGPKQILHI